MIFDDFPIEIIIETKKKVGHHLEWSHIKSKMCSVSDFHRRTRIQPVLEHFRHFAHFVSLYCPSDIYTINLYSDVLTVDQLTTLLNTWVHQWEERVNSGDGLKYFTYNGFSKRELEKMSIDDRFKPCAFTRSCNQGDSKEKLT